MTQVYLHGSRRLSLEGGTVDGLSASTRQRQIARSELQRNSQGCGLSS
jgi:hypothetical protein